MATEQLQLTLSDEEFEMIEQLSRSTKPKSKEVLVLNALSLFRWVAYETMQG